MAEVESDISWPEIIYINDNYSANVSRIFEYNCICRYPITYIVVHDNGTEFTVWLFKIILDTYGLESNPNTVKNPIDNKNWK